MDLYQYITLAAVAATTAYSLVNLFSSLKVTLSTTSRSKKKAISRLNILSGKINRFYETFLPPWRLGDRNEVRMVAVSTIFAFVLPFLLLTKGVVNLDVFEAVSLPMLPPFLFALFFPTYAVTRTSRIIGSRTSVSGEAASVEFTKSGGDLVWRMTSIMLFATLGTLYFEGFLVENFGVGIAFESPFYVEAIVATLLVAIPGFAIIGHSRTGLEVVTSSMYFSQSNHGVQLEVMSRAGGNAVFNYSGSLVSTGDSIYVKRADGFIQEIPWKGIVSIAVKERMEETASTTVKPSQQEERDSGFQ